MTTKAEILKDPYINQFLKDHPEASDEIKLAAEKLVDKSDAIPALKKLLPALLENARPPVARPGPWVQIQAIQPPDH